MNIDLEMEAFASAAEAVLVVDRAARERAVLPPRLLDEAERIDWSKLLAATPVRRPVPVTDRPATRCIMQVAEIRGPLGDIFRGYRINVAHPNLAAVGPWGSAVPSFQKPYLIASFGDYETETVRDAAIEKVTKRLAEAQYVVRLVGGATKPVFVPTADEWKELE